MRILLVLTLLPFLATSAMVVGAPLSAAHDPCDSYGDCVSPSVVYTRANPDNSLYVGDQFIVNLAIVDGSGGASCGQGCSESWYGVLSSVSWSYDHGVFSANTTETSGQFMVSGNRTGTFTISETAVFTVTITVTVCGQTSCSSSTYTVVSPVTVSEQVTVIQLVISPRYSIANVTDATSGFVSRNLDGSFYRNDTFCVNWSASFKFSDVRKDIVVNVTGYLPTYLREISANSTGRAGMACYTVKMDAPYHNAVLAVNFNAFNWRGVSIAHVSRPIPFAVVRYDPKFTTTSYMSYGNSTAPSSLERPWALFVRYDGNLPGYSYGGDDNTLPFNGSLTLQERAYFDNFTFTSLSYQPYNLTKVFEYHVVNSTGALRYQWLDRNSSAMLEGNRRIEKYVFMVEPSSLTPLLGQGYAYQNISMAGHWTHENGYALEKNYWLVPFLWSGRVNIISVDSNGDLVPNTPLSVTVQNPFPLDDWLTSNFEHVFGDDPQALRAFQEDLYSTNQTVTITGKGTLGLLLNQTSLIPPQISFTAGGVTQSGNFTFAPVFVNTTIMSVPDAFNGTVHYSNATIPLWSYNIFEGSLSFIPVSTTINQPVVFLEMVNNGSSGWISGNTTEPQTPSAFASQEYGFWSIGENLTVYANLQGGGVNLLGTQSIGPGEYQASFFAEPWSGAISSVQLAEGGTVIENESLLNPKAYPSPIPQGITAQFSITYPGTGQDVKAVFTNIWGAKTTIDLGIATSPPPPTSLIPETTAVVFGIAGIAWLIASGVLKTRKANDHH